MDKIITNTTSTWFYDNIYHEGNISGLPDFDVFSLLDISVSVITDLMVNAKMEI